MAKHHERAAERKAREAAEAAQQKAEREAALLDGIADLSIECHAGLLGWAGTNELVLNLSYEEVRERVREYARTQSWAIEFTTFSWKQGSAGIEAAIEPYRKTYRLDSIAGVLEVTDEQWRNILLSQSERALAQSASRLGVQMP